MMNRQDDNSTPEAADDTTRGHGSSALRRSAPDETQHIPLVSGTDAEPAARADSGLTLGERLAREAEAIRHDEDPNPPTGLVGTGPIRVAAAGPDEQAHGYVEPAQASQPAAGHSEDRFRADDAHIGSRGEALSTGAAPAASAAASSAPRQKSDSRYDDEAPTGLAAVADQTSRPNPAFLNGFDDDEVGDYVPGQWADSSDEPTTANRAVPVTSSNEHIPSTPTHTRAVPVTSRATGLAGAVAVGEDEDRIAAERRRDEDTPFLRRQKETPSEPVQERTAADHDYFNRIGLLEKEKETFGGLRLGTGFFGWITASGMMALLIGLAGAILGGVAYMNSATSADITRGLQSMTSGQTLTGNNGIIAAVTAGLILFLSFLSGGYVAGRMARFSGALQGFGVWLWFLAAMAAMTVAGIFGLGGLSRTSSLRSWLPSSETLTGPAGLITLGAVLLLALLAAVLGGLAGMRYHRKIDRWDYEEELEED